MIFGQQEKFVTSHPRGVSSIEHLLDLPSQHQVDRCYEALTCSDKILLAQLLTEAQQLPSTMSSRSALIILRDQLQKNAQDEFQVDRVSTALKAALLRVSNNQFFSPSIEDRELLARKLRASQELNSYLNNYLASIEAFYQIIEKIKENPMKSYMLYSLTDKENWQGKVLGVFVDIPDFDETPLGKSFDWVKSARGDLIHSFERTLIELNVQDGEANHHLLNLKSTLQQQFEQVEKAITSAELTILGKANSIKKTYQMALSATIIGATWGTAGPLMYAINGAGLYLGAESAIDLSESLIDSYGAGGSNNFFCSFARNNLKNYALENVFIDGAIGGGLAFVCTGILSAILKSPSKIANVLGPVALNAALFYGVKTIIASPLKQRQLLEEERATALEKGNQDLAQCLDLAKKKIASGVVINTSAILLSLKGIGEAQFGAATKNIKTPPPKISPVDNPGTTNVDKLVSAPKVKDEIYTDAEKIEILSSAEKQNAFLNDGVEIQSSETKSLFQSDYLKEKFKYSKRQPKEIITPGSMVSTGTALFRPKLGKLFSNEVEWSILFLKKQFKQLGPFSDLRSVKNIDFDKVENGEQVQQMVLETKERFRDQDFVLKHLRELLAEYEYFRLSELNETGPPKDFAHSWREFIKYIGEKEGLEVEVLEKKFYPREEFRQLVGKKLLFDQTFYQLSHGETSHALQVLFIYRHFKELQISDEFIDSFFVAIKDMDNNLWGLFFDGFGDNFGSPESVNFIFKKLKFYDSESLGI